MGLLGHEQEEGINPTEEEEKSSKWVRSDEMGEEHEAFIYFFFPC